MSRTKIIIEPGTLADVEYLQNTREWRALTPKQRAFVTDFLTTGDAPHALAAAYPKTTAASRRSFQSQVLHAQAVADFLEIWKWRNSREILLSICREQLKAAKEGSQAAASLTIQIERLTVGIQGTNKAHFKGPAEPLTEEPLLPSEQSGALTFFIGQRVTERDSQGVLHTGVVLEIDVDGKPSRIEEVK
jgi:hypothetical protein